MEPVDKDFHLRVRNKKKMKFVSQDDESLMNRLPIEARIDRVRELFV